MLLLPLLALLQLLVLLEGDLALVGLSLLVLWLQLVLLLLLQRPQLTLLRAQ